MKCPRCKAVFSSAPDATGHMSCPGCGARLKLKLPAVAPAAAVTAPDPLAGLLPVEPEPAPAGHRPLPAVAAAAAVPATLDDVLNEVRAVRRLQEQMMRLLNASAPPARASAPPKAPDGDLTRRSRAVTADPDYPEILQAPVVRSRRRKRVLLVDDDPQTREQAAAAFQAAEVPVTVAPDGSAAIAAMAAERPDVVVLELGIGGSMAGKDVVNQIKATMEWVDIPIVLHTRVFIESQKEARQIHGADDVVPKSADSAEALVAHVVALFRRS